MRLRDVAVALVGVLAVGGVGYLGWELLDLGGTEEDAPADDVAELASQYVAAWEDGDHAQMRSLVRDPPVEFQDRHEQLIDGTAATSLTVSADEVRHPVDGRAEVPLTISVTSDEVDEAVVWDSQLVLVRDRGEWAVSWTISTLHPELRPTWRFGIEREDPGRRDILAADGTPLAGPGEAVTFGFQPALVDDPDEIVAAFASALPGSESTAERELARDDLNDDWFYPVVTVSAARAETVAPRLRQATGILRRTEAEARTLYEDHFAQHTVGVVREATAEQLEELGEPYEPGDEIGQFGLEAVFEDELVGTEVVRVGLVDDGDGGEMRVVLGEGQRLVSDDVRTTLDVTVQRAVEAAIADVEVPAGIVVVDAEDGAIRGAASRPLGGYHRAFSGAYPPASTFKIVTAEAALATGHNLDDPVSCPAHAVVGGLQVSNAGDVALDETTLEEAFAASCNTTFATLAAQLGPDALTEAAHRFGFDVDYDLPLESRGGSFPEPQDTAELAAASFGQARTQASVLHMASVAAAVAGGTWHQPYLLADDVGGERRALATGTPDVLRQLLTTAVVDGTGDAADLAGTVGGKTGTAEAGDGVEHAWFVGVWQGYGFAILLEEAGSGGEHAAPLARVLVEVLSAALEDDAGETDDADPADDDPADDADPDTDAGETDEVDPVDDAAEAEDGSDADTDAPTDEAPDDGVGPP